MTSTGGRSKWRQTRSSRILQHPRDREFSVIVVVTPTSRVRQFGTHFLLDPISSENHFDAFCDPICLALLRLHFVMSFSLIVSALLTHEVYARIIANCESQRFVGTTWTW